MKIIILFIITNFVMINPINFIAKNLPNHKINIFGPNSLMFNTLPYYTFSILALLLALWPTHSSILLFVFYGFIPLLDELFSYDQRNPNQKERQNLEKNFGFTLALYVHVVVDWYCFFLMLNYFSTYQLTINSLFSLFLTIYAFSGLQAGQFAVAHQIFHRTDLFNRTLGTLHMSKNLYMHFTYNHLNIHHRRVATPEDPASAQRDITMYQFFPRTFIGSYTEVYQDQKAKKVPFYLNHAILSIMQAIAFPVAVAYFFGIQAAIIFAITAFISILYLEGINYIEHYGLRRKRLSDGTYQKTTIMHSWNAPHRVSNYLLFKLQRHSDHHENCLKHYQTLVSLPQSPMLPHGYTLMIILCFVPSKFFAIMNPLLDIESGQKQAKLKYQRAEILAKRFMVQCFLLFGAISLIDQAFY